MEQLEAHFFDISAFDTLAAGNTLIHRVDPAVKITATFGIILAAVSFDKYTLGQLIPFLLYPVILIFLGRLPFLFIIKKCLILLPFALLVSCYNLFADQTVYSTVTGFEITRGMISFSSIMLRFFISVSSVFALIGSTGFNRLCSALHKLHIPSVLVVQLLLLYRYLFVLMEEAVCIVVAHRVRSFGKRISFSVFFSLAGSLLVRSIERAERLYNAMLSRGFDGKIMVKNSSKPGLSDFAFLLFWLLFAFLVRFINIPGIIGNLFVYIFRGI